MVKTGSMAFQLKSYLMNKCWIQHMDNCFFLNNLSNIIFSYKIHLDTRLLKYLLNTDGTRPLRNTSPHPHLRVLFRQYQL
jgi:hypothetical protein